MDINRTDAIVLSLLCSEGALDKVRGMTLEEMRISEPSLTISNLRVRTKKMLQAGYLEEGFKSCNSKTYYVTQAGMKIISIV